MENGLFTFEDDDLIGFSQGFFVIVIHVVMNGIPFPDQRKFRSELRLCGHLDQVSLLLGTQQYGTHRRSTLSIDQSVESLQQLFRL